MASVGVWRGDGKRAADARSRNSGSPHRLRNCASARRTASPPRTSRRRSHPQTQGRRPDSRRTRRRASASRASGSRVRARQPQAPIESARPRRALSAVLLGRGARPVGSHRAGRRHRLGRRASAGDPGARDSEAAADDPDRRPRRQRAGDARRNGRRQCRAEGSAALSAEGLHRHRRPPVLFALRRRSDRHPARGGDQHPASRRFAGRLDADPAARQEPVPDPGAHAATQVAGSRTRALAGAQAFQVGDSRTLPQPGLFRLRRLWRRGRRATLFRQIRQERHDCGSRDAGGPGQIAVAAGAEPQPRRRRAARPDRADRDGGRQIHHRSAGARPRSGIPPTM